MIHTFLYVHIEIHQDERSWGSSGTDGLKSAYILRFSFISLQWV